jgi:hypothetical protein
VGVDLGNEGRSDVSRSRLLLRRRRGFRCRLWRCFCSRGRFWSGCGLRLDGRRGFGLGLWLRFGLNFHRGFGLRLWRCLYGGGFRCRSGFWRYLYGCRLRRRSRLGSDFSGCWFFYGSGFNRGRRLDRSGFFNGGWFFYRGGLGSRRRRIAGGGSDALVDARVA